VLLRARRGLAATAAALTLLVHPPSAAAITENNLLFLEAWRAVDKAYVDKTFNGTSWFKYRETTVKKTPMDSREETYAAIRVMLAKLDDPFTRFLEPEKYASLSESTMSANITGVGIEMAYRGGNVKADADQVVVVAPTPGGPADLAGVRPADGIIEVDGLPTKGLSLYEVAERLQGPQGSKVALTLAKDGSGAADAPRTVTVTRQKYALVPVQSKLCGPAAGTGTKVGYIRLSTFNQLSGSKVKEAVKGLAGDGAEAFVLDLRSNPGGLFPGALEIAKIFMNKGAIVYIADSDGVRDYFEADNTAIAPDAPLTLLVNKGTASASEVLAGALRDNNRARVLGETTFGKGLIQTLVPLSDGSAVSVTVARYQTPSGADINKVGIVPDGPLPVSAAAVEAAAAAVAEVASSGGESGGGLAAEVVAPAQLPMAPDAFCSVLAADAGVASKLFS